MAPPDLFEGLSFFILQRVPTRLSLIAAVKDHGGKVVLEEKAADILIGDHARKDVPPGFISWTFINESVKHGRLENQDLHRIAGPAKGTRPAAGGTAKSTRTAFTKEDDDLLRTWVSRRVSIEAGTHGNRIFKELAEKNPRHTWQSWRDRWVKKLAPVLVDEEQRPSEIKTERVLPSSNDRPVPSPSKTTRVTRVPFTEEDDEYLRSWMSHLENRGIGAKGQAIFKRLEEENPRHTWQSWRERWVKKLAPSVAAAQDQVESESEPDAQLKPADTTGAKKGKRGQPPSSPFKEPPARGSSPVKATHPSHGRSGSLPQQDDATPGTNEKESSPSPTGDERENQAIPATAKSTFPRGSSPRVASRPSSKGSSTESTHRGYFYEDLQQYRDAIGKPLVTSVTVTRRTVDLWELWSAVMAQDADPELRDWEDVARALGFDWVTNPTVTHQLKKAFEVHLRDFERLKQEFTNASGSDAESAQNETDNEPDEPRPDARPAPSSPQYKSSPPITGVKRKRDQLFEPGFRTYISFDSPRKRREYDREDTVPESPLASAHGSPPLLVSAPQEQRPRGRVDETAVKIAPLPAATEPETQDFGIIYEDLERTPSPSPSQQLLLECESSGSVNSPLARISAKKSSSDAYYRSQVPPVSVPSPSKSLVRRRDATPPGEVPIQSKRPLITASAEKRSPEPAARSDTSFDFEEEIDRLVSLGIDASEVIKAYKSTSMDKHLTGMVLEVLCRHEPIPEHPGVWTTKDDAALRYIEEDTLQRPEDITGPDRARMLRMVKHRSRLVAKHGEDALDRRRQFLQEWMVPKGHEYAA